MCVNIAAQAESDSYPQTMPAYYSCQTLGVYSYPRCVARSMQ